MNDAQTAGLRTKTVMQMSLRHIAIFLIVAAQALAASAQSQTNAPAPASTNSPAPVSNDALLNALVRKGILTQDEANQIQKEAAASQTNAYNTSASKWKLPDAIKVQDFRDGEYVDRELVLVKVAVDSKTRAEVMQITDIFRAKIVDVQPKSLAIEVTGNESKVGKFLELIDSFGITELTRTGKAALPRK